MKNTLFYLLPVLMIAGLTGCKQPTSSIAKGVDLGWLSEMEHDSIFFYNDNGQPTDCIELMKMAGANAVRLRVWVNHSTGWCNKEDVVYMAERVKNAGMRLMIDFHYSDYWADPAQQNIPKDWLQLDEYEMGIAIGAHTIDVLSALKEKGIAPEWIQIGNETTNGMLWPMANVSTDSTSEYCSQEHWARYARLSNCGYEAAKQIFPKAICIVHIDMAAYDRVPWYQYFQDAGGKFDMIGLSHYPCTVPNQTPFESNVGAENNIRNLYETFKKPIMVVEIGMNDNDPELAGKIMADYLNRVSQLDGFAGTFYWEPECYGGWRPQEYIPLSWNAYSMGAMTKDGRISDALKQLFTHE